MSLDEFLDLFMSRDNFSNIIVMKQEKHNEKSSDVVILLHAMRAIPKIEQKNLVRVSFRTSDNV